MVFSFEIASNLAKLGDLRSENQESFSEQATCGPSNASPDESKLWIWTFEFTDRQGDLNVTRCHTGADVRDSHQPQAVLEETDLSNKLQKVRFPATGFCIVDLLNAKCVIIYIYICIYNMLYGCLLPPVAWKTRQSEKNICERGGLSGPLLAWRSLPCCSKISAWWSCNLKSRVGCPRRSFNLGRKCCYLQENYLLKSSLEWSWVLDPGENEEVMESVLYHVLSMCCLE